MNIRSSDTEITFDLLRRERLHEVSKIATVCPMGLLRGELFLRPGGVWKLRSKLRAVLNGAFDLRWGFVRGAIAEGSEPAWGAVIVGADLVGALADFSEGRPSLNRGDQVRCRLFDFDYEIGVELAHGFDHPEVLRVLTRDRELKPAGEEARE